MWNTADDGWKSEFDLFSHGMYFFVYMQGTNHPEFLQKFKTAGLVMRSKRRSPSTAWAQEWKLDRADQIRSK